MEVQFKRFDATVTIDGCDLTISGGTGESAYAPLSIKVDDWHDFIDVVQGLIDMQDKVVSA